MTQNNIKTKNEQTILSSLSHKVHNIYTKTFVKGHDTNQQGKDQLKINNPHVIKGGLIGVAITALIRWNMVKYSRIGIIKKRWNLVKKFITIKQKPPIPCMFTNYYVPNLQKPAKNFMCYSGQAGIGKSTHFSHLTYTQSSIRPTLYFSFKFSGKDNNSFQQQIAEQAGWGENSPGIITQIIKVIKIIDRVNKNPTSFWQKVFLAHILIGSSFYGIAVSSIDATYGMIIMSALGLLYTYYLSFIYPLMIQSLRRTTPVLIFDDLNKIQQLNMFSQIVRCLQLLQNRMANVILISPDEDTWCRLRRQPGVKDRLRVKQIFYDHIFTAQHLLNYIEDENNFQAYMNCINGNKLYTKNIVISLAKQLIGKRQVTLRRFTSILILNDEEQYEKLVSVLKQCSKGKISVGQAVQQFTDILYESQSKTMVANLKSIQRQLKITEQKFLQQLNLLLKKKKLPSDNLIAPQLKAYNIVRDLQSDYIFNGKFMFNIFNIAIKQYQKSMKQYKETTIKQFPSLNLSANISYTTTTQTINDKQNQVNVQKWNSSNTIAKKQLQRMEKR